MLARLFFTIAVGNNGASVTAQQASALAEGIFGSQFTSKTYTPELDTLAQLGLVVVNGGSYSVTAFGQELFFRATADAESVRDSHTRIDAAIRGLGVA